MDAVPSVFNKLGGWGIVVEEGCKIFSDMSIFNQLIIVCWIVFMLVWGFLATKAKQNIGRNAGWGPTAMGIRIILLVGILALVRLGFFHGIPDTTTATSPLMGTAGVIVTALGIAYAIWARVSLGRNWGMPMSVKQNPELVTSGPYAYSRHPIYTGVIFGMLGSALAVGNAAWLIAPLAGALYFAYSATQEEKLLLKEFPDQYPAYMKRTKMLIPWIF